MREIALDTETTGLDPYSGHRIVEIGCVELVHHVRTDRHFHVYINPERAMPPEAEQVHGLSSEFLKDKPVFADIAAAFWEFIGDDPLVIHNASFDLKFLNYELEKLGYPKLPPSRATDTVLMARQKFPGQPANLDALCKRFEIDLSRRVKHGALLDAELLSEVYLELRGGRQAGLELASRAQLQQRAAENADLPSKLEARQFPPSAEELLRHQALLDKMKAPLWRELEETN